MHSCQRPCDIWKLHSSRRQSQNSFSYNCCMKMRKYIFELLINTMLIITRKKVSLQCAITFVSKKQNYILYSNKLNPCKRSQTYCQKRRLIRGKCNGYLQFFSPGNIKEFHGQLTLCNPGKIYQVKTIWYWFDMNPCKDLVNSLMFTQIACNFSFHFLLSPIK